MRLSLLRGPTWPDPEADQGEHRFVYSLFPHAGNWRDAGTMQQGYELNDKLIPLVTTPHAGALAPRESFLSIEPATVAITAIKKAEDDDSMIVRFYEWAGRRADVTLHFATNVGAGRDASEANLMEKVTGKLTTSGDAIVVPTGPYEIETVRIVRPARSSGRHQ